jgi:hypothetical protein
MSSESQDRGLREAAQTVVDCAAAFHFSATGYLKSKIDALAAALAAPAEPAKHEPEWRKCPQCSRENSTATWEKFGGKCPNCGDLFEKEASEPAAPAPAQPEAGDVVERMCKAMREAWEKRTGKEWKRKDNDALQEDMTAALAVAREGCYTLAEIEKAIHAVYISCGWKVSIEYFADSVLRRLTAKPEPTLQERVAIILDNRWQFVDAHQRKETAEMIVAELEKEKAK